MTPSDRSDSATLIRDVGWRGDARLYRLDPPIAYERFDGDDFNPTTTEYVIVSAVDVPYSGPETYIFPAREDGTCRDMGEIHGSYRGGLDHERALRIAGYEVIG